MISEIPAILGLCFASVPLQALSPASPSLSASVQPAPTEHCAHVVNSFRFEIAASMARVAPLFAPEAERRWAGEHWNPVFAYPNPGRDMEGAVWTIRHGTLDAVWVNTIFDVSGGHMQYVAVVPDQLAMIVDVRVTSLAAQRTAVEVTYARTALHQSLNRHVIELGDRDRQSGPDWKRSLEAVLGLPHN